MITGKIYSNGYWDGLEAVYLKEDPDNPEWVYVLATELPDISMSMNHAIGSKVTCFHAKTQTNTPTTAEIENTSHMIYVKNS